MKEPAVEPVKGTGTILVIEDEEAVMDMSRAILERLGCRVLEARAGTEAANLANGFAGVIDLAILDIGFPAMRGEHVHRALVEARPGLKVIVCSGYALNGLARKILNAGAEGFIQKPYALATLSAKLKEVLEEK